MSKWSEGVDEIEGARRKLRAERQARIDKLIKDGDPSLLELNPLVGSRLGVDTQVCNEVSFLVQEHELSVRGVIVNLLMVIAGALHQQSNDIPLEKGVDAAKDVLDLMVKSVGSGQHDG